MNDKHTDAVLVQRYLSGTDAAFETLYRRYERPLFSYVLKLVGDRSRAEDIFQQTWMKVIRALGSYDEKAKFASWLFGIAHNCCIDQFRQDARRRNDLSLSGGSGGRLSSSMPLPDAVLERKDELAGLALAIDKLPAEQRQVVLMRIQGDVPFRDIAALMECSLNTVLGRMHYAVKNLKKYMNDYLKEDLQNALS